MPALHPHPTLIACALGALLSACVSESPALDARWGQSLSQAQAQQTANADARNAQRSPIETDGEIARLGIARMHRAYENPPPPMNVLNLGVGTPVGSGPQ